LHCHHLVVWSGLCPINVPFRGAQEIIVNAESIPRDKLRGTWDFLDEANGPHENWNCLNLPACPFNLRMRLLILEDELFLSRRESGPQVL
jgi:hypothetical protein